MLEMSGKTKKGKGNSSPVIAANRKARHEYFLEDRFEAGLSLVGWEVKSIRDGRIQIGESYVVLHKGEAFLEGANISPLISASTHVTAEPQRKRKLLLHARELSQIFSATQQKGYTCIPLNIYWKNNRIKLEIALARGKQSQDKRQTKKDQDWQRQKERLMKNSAY